ncbi:MAG: hypothetical protein KIS77_02670 [Saprospiraceae bacterium]|nr:hypothetical protein [Saprospiraceae bacterium]
MKKALVLTFVFGLITFAKAWSQTEPSPAQRPAVSKDKTEQMKKAEEKSDGAAYSGKGKGGEKDMMEKQKDNKGKAKGQSKAKKAKQRPTTDEARQDARPASQNKKPSGDVPQPAKQQEPQQKKAEPKKQPSETTPNQRERGGNP